MSETVIRVENLSKQYRLGVIGSNTLRDDVARLLARLRRRPDPTLKVGQSSVHSEQSSEAIWALKDVSFEVKQGEVVGIIGRNGAGKSTLLKILSRITAPTSGHVKVKGRIASLLEVGTGFHPELTGRENIYLNGAILGMKRAEIARKLDEIVDFSGVEQFIDTPVKRYSSGMYVRLAFAVAAHLEPEILLVDEVLAVGDAEFQKKCLGKMGEVAKEGRTVLFVSHNMGAISMLTRQALLLEEGVLQTAGSTDKVVAAYLSSAYHNETKWVAPGLNSNPMQIVCAEIRSEDSSFDVRKGIEFIIDYEVRQPIRGAIVAVIIHAPDGAALLSTEDIDLHPELLEERVPGRYRATVHMPGNWLSPGTYLVRLFSAIVFQRIFDDLEVMRFDLIETGNPKIRAHKKAYLLPYLDWTQEKIGEYG